MVGKKKIKIKYIRLILFTALFSYIITNLLLSDTMDKNRILAAGQVYEVRNKTLTSMSSTWRYDEETEQYTIISNDAVKKYGKWNNAVDWKCIYLKLDKLNVPQVDWVLKEYDENGQFSGQQIITLKNGENWIALQPEVPFRRFSIQIIGGEGLQFQIKKMVLMENIPQKRQGILLFGLIFVAAFAAGILLQKKCGQKRYVLTACQKLDGFLQYGYELTGNGLALTSKKKKEVRRIRSCLFCFLTAYMIVMYNCNLYSGKAYYRYHTFVAVIVLLLITFLSREGRLKAVKSQPEKVYWWYVFWLLTCVSDFVVSKRFKFTGWIMLLVMGFFVYVWRQMKDPDEIIWDFLHGIELFAVIGMLYNMIFRLKYDGLLYNGYMTSASDFGIFSAFLVLIFSIEIYECLRIREYGKKLAGYICGLGIAGLQVLLSGKEIAVFVSFCYTILLLFYVGKAIRSLSRSDKKNMIFYLLYAGVAVVVYYLAVKHIPWILKTMTTYEKEQFETLKDPAVIGILAQSGIEAYQNVRYHSLNEWFLTIKAYIREMNLFGHKAVNLSVWNKPRGAENQILQVMFRYGIFAAAAYVMMFVAAVKTAVEKCRKYKKNIPSGHLLTLGVILFFIVAGFFGNVEYPFYQPVWLLVYMFMAKCFLAVS